MRGQSSLLNVSRGARLMTLTADCSLALSSLPKAPWWLSAAANACSLQIVSQEHFDLLPEAEEAEEDM